MLINHPKNVNMLIYNSVSLQEIIKLGKDKLRILFNEPTNVSIAITLKDFGASFQDLIDLEFDKFSILFGRPENIITLMGYHKVGHIGASFQEIMSLEKNKIITFASAFDHNIKKLIESGFSFAQLFSLNSEDLSTVLSDSNPLQTQRILRSLSQLNHSSPGYKKFFNLDEKQKTSAIPAEIKAKDNENKYNRL